MVSKAESEAKKLLRFWNYQNADCSLQKLNLLCTVIFGRLSFPAIALSLQLKLMLRSTNSLTNGQRDTRAVHGSILCDSIQPIPSADWPNPLQVEKVGPNPTQPNATDKFNGSVQPNLI